MDETTKELRRSREAVYGPCKAQHDNLGVVWAGLLQQHYGIKLPHPVPGHVVALMTACLKAVRAATPVDVFHPDSYADGMAYFEIAKDCDNRNPENIP